MENVIDKLLNERRTMMKVNLRKRILTLILTLAIVISSIPAMTPIVRAATTISTSLKGLGTEDEPFEIGSVGDLLYMANQVNSNAKITSADDSREEDARTAHYILTNDIALGY